MSGRALVLLGATVLFLSNLWGYDLWAPDEPFFAEGAREMLVDGQWLVVHVNGVINTHKPPLFFWLISLFSLPFGAVGALPARLVSVCAALGTVALTMRICRRDADARTALLAGAVLATTYLFWEKARWAQIDALLCLLIWVALDAFLEFRAGRRSGRAAGLVFWGASALAVLAKGPVGLLLPLGIALLTLAFDRNLAAWRRFAPLLGPALFAAVACAWAVPASVLTEGYSVLGALREHFVNRAMHGMHHAQPWYYFLVALPPVLLPWTGLVPGALVLAWRKRSATDLWLLVVVAFVIVFFSISTEKRELYALPAIPAFAMLVARFAGHVMGWEQGPGLGRRWWAVGQGIVGTLLALVGVALPFVAARQGWVGTTSAAVIGVPLLAGGVIALIAALRDRPWPALLAPAAGTALALILVPFLVYPQIDMHKSTRPFAAAMRDATAASRAAGHPVVAFDLGNLPNSLAFYTDGVYTIETLDPAVLAKHLRNPERVWAVMNEARVDELPADVRGSLNVLERTRLSRRDMALVHNGAPVSD